MLDKLTTFEKWILTAVAVIVASSVAMSFIDEEFFIHRIVVEDGPVEWATVFGLLSCAGLALLRFFRGKQHGRKAAYLGGLLLTVAVFTFGARSGCETSNPSSTMLMVTPLPFRVSQTSVMSRNTSGFHSICSVW